jgi:hypothetical protein
MLEAGERASPIKEFPQTTPVCVCTPKSALDRRTRSIVLRSKTDVAMKYETLAKFVCHNVCCVIQAMHELGISPDFA